MNPEHTQDITPPKDDIMPDAYPAHAELEKRKNITGAYALVDEFTALQSRLKIAEDGLRKALNVTPMNSRAERVLSDALNQLTTPIKPAKEPI